MFLARWNGDAKYQIQVSEVVGLGEAGGWITAAPPQGAQTGLAPVPSFPADPWQADCLFDLLAYLPGSCVMRLSGWLACWLNHSLTWQSGCLCHSWTVGWLAGDIQQNGITLQLDCLSVGEGKCDNWLVCNAKSLKYHLARMKGVTPAVLTVLTLLQQFPKAYSHYWHKALHGIFLLSFFFQ